MMTNKSPTDRMRGPAPTRTVKEGVKEGARMQPEMGLPLGNDDPSEKSLCPIPEQHSPVWRCSATPSLCSWSGRGMERCPPLRQIHDGHGRHQP